MSRDLTALRAKLDAIVARDRSSAGVDGRPTETLYSRRAPAAPQGGGSPPRGGPRSGSPSTPPFETHERRIALETLGLNVVGQSVPDPGVLVHLGLRGEPPRRWEDILFLDTETTGLAGGTGTYVFLLGTAHLEDGELVLRQHLLSDLGAERAYVAMIAAELERFRACASYNGKSFDLPLLRSRFVMTIRTELSVDESHLDLLHPARRLWRGRFGSVTLRQIEESILDDGRTDDIPGALIPERYFRYLRERDPRLVEPILGHNARDVISLVRVADRVATAVIAARAGRAPDHPPAALALAQAFERAKELEAAFCCYESAYVEGDLDIRVRAALPYARALERRGDAARAFALVETLFELGLGTPTWRASAEARLRRLSRRTAAVSLRSRRVVA
ncbi:MAG TPA: ribonuclease H-like domain-containing protein [Candidatus Limnocylindria bacterium]|nr:ribonuclease H-like domain-containing protein [Candidatus Limnocylindria bacterium]